MASDTRWEYLRIRESELVKAAWRKAGKPFLKGGRWQREVVQTELNLLGEEGWELVALVRDTLMIFGCGGGLGFTYVFKRPKDKELSVERVATTDR